MDTDCLGIPPVLYTHVLQLFGLYSVYYATVWKLNLDNILPAVYPFKTDIIDQYWMIIHSTNRSISHGIIDHYSVFIYFVFWLTNKDAPNYIFPIWIRKQSVFETANQYVQMELNICIMATIVQWQYCIATKSKIHTQVNLQIHAQDLRRNKPAWNANDWRLSQIINSTGSIERRYCWVADFFVGWAEQRSLSHL